MKLFDEISKKIGTDKIMHFLCGGWITSLFSPFGWLGVIFGFILTIVISFIKELWLDSDFDSKDIIAAEVGSVVAILFYSIFTLLL